MDNLLVQTSGYEHIATMNAESEEGTTWVLDYYIIKMLGVADETLYGLKIDKSTSGGEILESDTTYAITEDYGIAQEIAKAFASGMVFPITMAEMVDEWFGGDDVA